MGNFTQYINGGKGFSLAGYEPEKARVKLDPIDEFESHFYSLGYVLERIEFDKWVYCRNTAHASGKKKSWYRLSLDPASGVAFAVFGDWTLGDEIHKWRSGGYSELTLSAREDLMQRIEQAAANFTREKTRKQNQVARDAAEYIAGLPDADSSYGYLAKKGVQARGVLWDAVAGELIIPTRNGKGEIRGYQRIYENEKGETVKKFVFGMEKAGNYFQLGRRITEPTYICEGYATAASLHEATKKCVLVSFDAGNMVKVAREVRKQTTARIVFAADNDEGKETNTGIEAANAAQIEIPNSACQWPTGIAGTDFNDMHAELGIGELKEFLGVQERTGGIEWIDAANAPAMEPLDYVVEDFLIAGTYSILWGVDGTGKSLLVQDLALSICTGSKWAGREVKKGAVLYIMGEGHPDMQNRITGWRKYNKRESEHFNLHYSAYGVDLTDSLNHGELEEKIESMEDETGEKVSLVVVDTLSTNFGDGSEKDDKDARAFVRPLIKMANRAGVAVLVVHHGNKSGEGGASGSRLFQGDAYTKLEVTRPGMGDHIKLTTRKMKSGHEPKPVNFKFKTIDIGSQIDHKGRQVRCVPPVCVFDGDESFTQSDADAFIANATGGDRGAQHQRRLAQHANDPAFLKLGGSQKLVFNIIADIAAEQAANMPGRDSYAVRRDDLVTACDKYEIAPSSRSRCIKILESRKIITQSSGMNFAQYTLPSRFI